MPWPWRYTRRGGNWISPARHPDTRYNRGMTDTTAATLLPRPLRALAGRALEAALNRAVALDPDTRESLGALEGRRVHLHLRGPGLALVIHVQGGKLEVEPPDDDTPASLRVAASPGNLLCMVLRAGSDTVAPGMVHSSGDADPAQRRTDHTRC